MFSYVTLPTNFLAQISTPATTIFGDLAPVAEIAIGIALALMLIDFIIVILARRREGKNTPFDHFE